MWSRKVPVGVGALLLVALAAHGELDRWVENVESGSKLDGVFFRAFPVGAGSIVARRQAKETRAELSKLIAASPAEADLVSLRALEAEKMLDFTAAEADWNKYVELAKDQAAAKLSLADYYHRRLMAREEIAALRAAAAVPSAEGEASPQKAWIAYERIVALIDEQALGGVVAAEQYQAWVARYPKDSEVYRRACLALIGFKQFVAAEQVLGAYERAFPGAADFPTEARAGLELAKGSPERALAAYEKSLKPVWSEQLAAGYFALLKEEGLARKSVDQARVQIAVKPTDLTAAARLFYLLRAQSDTGGAARVLADFRQRKEARKSGWSPAEHEALATLFDRTNQYDDAARHYHALYVHRGATAAQSEWALAGLVELLLNAAEQPIQIGAGDLSYYHDIAKMDRSPGYLNGVLSLLLNSQNAASEYAKENANAVSYFHRVKAAQLDGVFEQRYPQSERRAGLRAKLIQAYATYGETKGVIDNGRLFLTAFPDAPQRVEVALLMADGHARLGQPDSEFALYKQLLVELAAHAGGKPIGVVGAAAVPAEAEPSPASNEPGAGDRGSRLIQQAGARQAKADGGVRSLDYVRVLDRYLARLVSLNRMPEALRVYRGELTRNANDPGLYERFAAFLDQNKLGAEIERVYKDAIQHFPEDTQWSHRLARWYLRGRQQAKYAELTQQVSKIFSGTDLEAYLRETGDGAVGAQMYLQVNQYAHQRFPHNLTFVRNLLTAYQARTTANPVAYEKLLRESWYHADDLRGRYFELLSRTRRLDAELASLRTAKPDPEKNPAAARALAEGEIWKTNFEAAAAPMRALAASMPAEAEVGGRAALLHRSLNRAETALQIESNLAKAEPRSREVLTRIGEIEANHEHYDRAAAPWIRMAVIEPGKADGYLEAATVFWDYFQFNDALKMIEQGRAKLGNPALFAYEAGAIHENQRDYAGALNEYAKGALAEGAGRCRERLLRLSRRTSLAAQAEALTARIGASPGRASIGLRIGFLEGQNRAADLQQYLTSTLAGATSSDVISTIETAARASEMRTVLRRVIERRIAITSDPVERLRTRMDLARLYESRGDGVHAAETVDGLYRENPVVYGVIRNAVNYYWRNKQAARAVDLLVASADRAQQPYQDRFRFEAAQKAIEGGQYDRGQQLISALLAKEPYRADYLALGGDVYAKRGDDAGLRTYYLNTIEGLKQSPLAAEDKIARVASLRRAFIPVLVRLKDYAAATDQYVEVINRYPEDEAFVREAALFALQHGERGRLTEYYTKTASTAPRDHRWPIVLSRVETQAENFPAALEWLAKARAIRPERTDFLAAKGPIEERLLRFEDAAKTYASLWELSYHDPAWMVKCGEQFERLGRHGDAISALNRAFVEGRPENYLAAATQALQWNELEAAREFVTKGKGASAGLKALEGVLAARQHLPLPAPYQDTDGSIAREWGAAVAAYSTPEEKAALAAKLIPATGLVLAQSAGFLELLTRWEPEVKDGALNVTWLQLMLQRGRLDEIGPRLEGASKNGTLSGEQRDLLLARARQYYAESGNSQAELRLLEQRRASGMRDSLFISRYAALAARDNRTAVAVASSDPAPALRDAVANRVVMNGRATDDAMAIIKAQGTAFKPVWTSAFTALAGVYFDLRTPQVRAAFSAVLGPQTIGEQLGHPPNEDVQAAGAPWFYYASRFGEYLGTEPAAEDYRLAQVEAAPLSPVGYTRLADYYQEQGDYRRAAVEYDYVLQLDPGSPVAHARKGHLLALSGGVPAAVAEWRLALLGFQREIDGKPSASWWSDLGRMLDDLGSSLGSVREDIGRVLRTGFQRNGQYNSEALIPAILKTPEGTQWLLELSRSAPEPNQILEAALPFVADGERDLLYARQVENAQSKANATLGNARAYLQENVVNLQVQRILELMNHGQAAAAERLLQVLPQSVVEGHSSELAAMQVRIAARRGTLNALLERYQRDPLHAPPVHTLTAAAAELRGEQDEANANRVLDYMYTRELDARNFTGANFLGLAGVRLANHDLPGALELLRRMNLMVADPFVLLNDSAMLLWRTGYKREAAGYFDQLVQVQPWQPTHRLNAARVKLDARSAAVVDELAALAKNPTATYATRVEAAKELRKAGGVAGLNSGAPEIDLIAGQAPVTEAQANKPFYVAGRLIANGDAEVRFRMLSAAVSISGGPRVDLFRSAVETKRWFLANSLVDQAFDTDVGLLRHLIEVKEQIGEPQVPYKMKLAGLLKGSAKADVEREIAVLNAAAERSRQNEARRPVIGEAILPDRVVRPRMQGGLQ